MAEPAAWEPQLTTLSNGMTYLRVHIPGATKVQVEFIVRAGSRDESPADAGLAHCLEHFLFKGAEGYPTAFAISDAIDRLGGSVNAFTDTEMVGYHAESLAADMPTVLKIVAAIVTQPLFPAGDWSTERGRLLSELATRASIPEAWLQDELNRAVFGGTQPMAWTAGGNPAVVAASDAATLVQHHQRFYDPRRTAIVICGGQTPEPAEVERLVAHMPRGSLPPRVPAVWGQGAQFVGKPLQSDPAAHQIQLALAVPGLPVGREAATELDEMAMAMVGTLLAGGASTPAQRIVRKQPDVASEVGCSHTAYSDAGVFVLHMTTTPATQQRAMRLMIGELRRIADTPPTAAAIARARIQRIAQLGRTVEEAPGATEWFADRWGNGREVIRPDQYAERIRAITPEAVQRAAKQLVAGLQNARMAFTHPVDPATGLNAAGQTMEQSAAMLLRAAMTAPGPRVEHGLR